MRRTSTWLMLLLTIAAPASAQMLRAFERETAILAKQPRAAGLQDGDPAWDRVRGLREGKAIMLWVGALETEEVRFLQADESSLTVKGIDGTRTVRKADVREIRNPWTHHSRNGMLWGLLGGSIIGLAKCGLNSTLVGFCGMLGGGIGMGLGAAVGGAANVDAKENLLIYRRAY